MQLLGIIDTNTMARPQRSLNAEEAAAIKVILSETGLLC
jgi:4-hydroxy-tetrahydrodipicolinate synthase